MSQRRKDSQFAGAAKIFQQLDQTVQSSSSTTSTTSKGRFRKSTDATPPPAPPEPSSSSFMTTRSNREMKRSIDTTAFSPVNRVSDPVSVSNKALKPPPFVSPVRTSRPSWSAQQKKLQQKQQDDSSLLDDSFRSQSERRFRTSGSRDELLLSPSPDSTAKEKVNAKSWKHQISFQASPSPGALKKKSVTPSFGHQNSFGASFLSPLTKAKGKLGRQDSSTGPFEETPDIKIEVKIPDIDKKIRARKEAILHPVQEEGAPAIPEFLMKQRQREENVKRKQQEIEDRMAGMLQALVRAWNARREFKELRAQQIHRVRQQRILQQKNEAATKIQKTWRMVLPRKRFLYLRECRRRRERNEKEIKRITKVIAKMPKTIKADIKEMKSEYADKKTQLKKQMKQMLKEDEKRLEAISKSGRDMIEYLKGENDKLREKHAAMKNEYGLLSKQFDVLTLKSDEIAANFSSLQAYVQRKSASIQKNEINSQKCRHRYLPKYRELIQERDRHCIMEHRVRSLYKDRIKAIVGHISKNCKDRRLVDDIQETMAYLEHDLNNLPTVPIPDGLENKF